jgi:2'-5' RNA ligase
VSDNSIWVGYGVRLPGIHDPHITLAYFEHDDAQDMKKDVGSYNRHGQVNEIVKNFHNWAPHCFEAIITGEAFYNDGETKVLEVTLPETIQEAISNLRSSFYMRGIKFSTKYSFNPHITLGPDYIPEAPVPTTVWVTNLFIDSNGFRNSWKLEGNLD